MAKLKIFPLYSISIPILAFLAQLILLFQRPLLFYIFIMLNFLCCLLFTLLSGTMYACFYSREVLNTHIFLFV